jgi:hypothetical protein
MTTTDTTAVDANDPMRNGVDTATLFATLDAVKADPDIAKFRFRATTLRGDDPDKLRSVVEQSRQRSAVYDIVTNGVPVSIDVNVD